MIIYLRRLQYFKLYDRCTTRNAHFTYEFHIVIGRHTANYGRLDSHLIVDLLDNQLISTMTIQIPGSTIFSENQVFMFRHSRENLRCVRFTIYRRHPIKDVRSVRVAHSCGNLDSRLFVYGINLYDATNGENRFFPITTLVKYRGTQWALNTTFEPKSDTNFVKLGCDCYDPYSLSIWPTHIEMLIFVFYIWCSVLCFGHLISASSIGDNVALHALTITFTSGTSAIVIGFVYLRLIKIHIIDQHYESNMWCLLRWLVITIVIALCLAFWRLALDQTGACSQQSFDWMVSSLCSASLLTVAFSIAYLFVKRKRVLSDSLALEESENNLMKTNSKPGIEFVREGSIGLFVHKGLVAQPNDHQVNASKKNSSGKSSKTAGSGNSKASASGKRTQTKKKNSESKQRKDIKNPNTEDTLENAFANSAYMKTKNRNSISQYV